MEVIRSVELIIRRLPKTGGTRVASRKATDLPIGFDERRANAAQRIKRTRNTIYRTEYVTLMDTRPFVEKIRVIYTKNDI